MKNITFILFILILNYSSISAQDSDKIENQIKSIQFVPKGEKQGYPIINLHSPLPLSLTFDILGEEAKSLLYRIVYCDIDWTPSDITVSRYLNSVVEEFYIDDFEYSFNTKTNYTHYSLNIPNEDITFKLSGNYIIEVYDENNPDDTLLSRHFFVAENSVAITGKVKDDNNARYLKSNQIVNFTVNDENNVVKYPRRNMTAVVSQNFRWGKKYEKIVKPLFIGKNTMQFKYMNRRLSFEGGYEFPYFNVSDIQQPDNTVHSIEVDEYDLTHCYLNPDKNSAHNYFLVKDMNGSFQYYAYNRDNVGIEGEYVFVHFSFVSEKLPYEVYVSGAFNNWELTSRNAMIYDSKYGVYHTSLFLKQGVYNYTYVGKISDEETINLLGDFKETENDYYIFIYNRDDSLRADRLIGWIRLNSIEHRQ